MQQLQHQGRPCTGYAQLQSSVPLLRSRCNKPRRQAAAFQGLLDPGVILHRVSAVLCCAVQIADAREAFARGNPPSQHSDRTQIRIQGCVITATQVHCSDLRQSTVQCSNILAAAVTTVQHTALCYFCYLCFHRQLECCALQDPAHQGPSQGGCQLCCIAQGNRRKHKQ